jgi:hypothetical protein
MLAGFADSAIAPTAFDVTNLLAGYRNLFSPSSEIYCAPVEPRPSLYFAARFPSMMSTQIGRASSPPVPPVMIFLGWSKPTQAPQTS